MMARYFSIGNGLGGCYMPDSMYSIKVDTRRELKAALQWEADSIRDAGGIGLCKKTVARLAAAAWKDWPKQLNNAAPYKWKGQDSYPYTLQVYAITRAVYLESSDEN